HLALLAEMMKGKPWTLATLKEVGGTEGIGVAFLEETFASPTAHPKHRLHQQAARAVLKALLPEPGADIRGNVRSWQQLLQACTYANRPRDFADLIQILDSEVRLITPADPDGVGDVWRAASGEGGGEARVGEGGSDATHHQTVAPNHAPPAIRYYQLTH